MFFSSVHADDDLKRYPAAIQKAIEYAKNTDFSALEDGRQEIDGDKMYANLFHLTSKQKEEAHPELHKKYVDVQYWICGEELCGPPSCFTCVAGKMLDGTLLSAFE